MKRILDYYEEATRGMAIKSKSRDCEDPNLNVLDAIKRNIETFDREGTSIDEGWGFHKTAIGMDYEEFCWALGDTITVPLLKSFYDSGKRLGDEPQIDA